MILDLFFFHMKEIYCSMCKNIVDHYNRDDMNNTINMRFNNI